MAVGEDEGFHIADAYVEVHADTDPFRREVAGLGGTAGPDAERGGRGVGERLGRGIGDGADGNRIGERVTRDIDRTIRPRAQRSGNDAGDKLSQGFQLAMVRNSPLIAAAVAGALTAGAPAAIAGVTSLFAAIAAASVSGNIQVSTQFKQLGDHIQDTFRQAGQVAIPYFLESIHRLSAGISGLGPQFHEAFSALGPDIAALTSGVMRFVQNSMPGMVGAVKSAEPVMRGLSDLLGDIGSGLSDFFDNVSAHAPAAGGAFSALGSILSALLPILGDLLGEGAELANAVLPPVAAALHVVAGALHLVAPVLPTVVAGFLALKGAAAASAALAGLNQRLAFASYSGGAFAGTAGRASTAVSGLRSALGPLALSLVAIGALWSASNSTIDDWTKAIEQGGSQAQQALAEAHAADSRSILDAHSLSDAWGIVKGSFASGAAQIEGYAGSQDKATQKAKEYYNSLTPLGKAQADVTRTQNDYIQAVTEGGRQSQWAEQAGRKYADAQKHEADVEDKLNIAIHGVTQAMIDQADEALAAIDSTFGLQHAQNQQRDAEIALKDAIKQHGQASIEAHDAQQAYIESIYDTAKAAAQLKADQSGLKQGTLEYKNYLDSQLLVSLEKVSSTLNGPEKAAIDGFIANLKSAGITTDVQAGKLDNLGNKKPTPKIAADASIFDQVTNVVNSTITALGGKRPTPKVAADASIFSSIASYVDRTASYLGHLRPQVIATAIANMQSAQAALDNWLYRNNGRTIIVNAVARTLGSFGVFGGATGGRVGDIAGFSGGGKIKGPGGPTDDLIPAFADGGRPIRVSNLEWIINGAVSRAQGDRKMAALNSGQADIVPKGATVTGQASLSIGELHVHIEGSFDFTKPDTIRTLAQKLDTALAELHRSRS